jgi:transposase
MKLYGAIDLHSNNNVTVLIDEQDQVVYQKRLPNDLPLIAQQLSTYQDALQGIVVESTYNWYWLVDGLMEQGHRVHLANTAAIQQYEGLKYTDDTSGRPLARPHSAVGSFAARLHLSERGASGTRSDAQTWPTGASKNDQPAKHTESDHA